MNIDSLYRPSKLCWRVPTRCCFALMGKIDVFTSAHNNCIWPNDFGIDDLNEVLRLLIGQIDYSSAGENPQIPIACTLI